MVATDVNSVVFAGTRETADLVAKYIYDNIPTGTSLATLERTSHGILVAYKSALIWNTEYEPAKYDPRWERSRSLIIHLQDKTAYTREQIENFLYALQNLAASGSIDLGDYDPMGTMEAEDILAEFEQQRAANNGNGGGLGLALLLTGGALLALVVFGRRRKHRQPRRE